MKVLFAGQTSAGYEAFSQMHGACGIQHYAVNSMLYLCTIKTNTLKFMVKSFYNYVYMQSH